MEDIVANNFDLLDEIILLKIFNYLPIKTLNKLSFVCSKWSRLIRETKLKRKENVYLTLLNSNKWIYNQTAKSFRMSKEDFVLEFNNDLNKLYTQPNIFIYFLTHHFNDKCIIESTIENSNLIVKRPRRSFRVKENEKLSHLIDVISSLLPKDSTKLFFFPSDIIGTNLEQTITLDYDIDAISGLLLPQSTQTYRIDVRKIGRNQVLSSFNTSKEFYEFFHIDIENGEKLKYMLMIVRSPKRADLRQFLRFINNKIGNVCVSGGLIFDDIDVLDNEVTILNFISKNNSDSSVKISQIIAPDMHRSEFDDYFNDKLELLKKDVDKMTVDQQHRTSFFAIKINCIGRGSEFHGIRDHELNLFRKKFSNSKIPIVGFYAEGEIGHEYLSNLNLTSDRIDFYSYSSIFTLIKLI